MSFGGEESNPLLQAFDDLYARSHDICVVCLQTYNVVEQEKTGKPHCKPPKKPRATPVPSEITLRRIVPWNGGWNGVEPWRGMVRKVRMVLDGRLDPRLASAKADDWASACFHPPKAKGHELILVALNDLLQGSGVEALQPPCQPEYDDGGVRMCPLYSYVNMGDTYDETIVRDHERGRWLVSSWGDLLERHERKCAECRRLLEGESWPT